MPDERVACLTSGGLDSGVLLGELARTSRVLPVYIRSGLRWEDVELSWLVRFLEAIQSDRIETLRILTMPLQDLYGTHWSLGKGPVPDARSPDEAMFLPGRNILLLAKLAVLAGLERIKTIAIGSLGGNPFPDATPEFFTSFEQALSMGLAWPTTIHAPFRHLSKAQVIHRGRDLPLELTFSCVRPVGSLHCGQCNKCAERRRAFAAAGLEDRTRYAREKGGRVSHELEV